jgi:hypothetical protein
MFALPLEHDKADVIHSRSTYDHPGNALGDVTSNAASDNGGIETLHASCTAV